jgi:hypothetical protein
MRQGHIRLLLFITFVFSAACWMQAQSLGDIARKEQAKKGPAQHSGKVITNDDLDNLRKGSTDQITTASSPSPKSENRAADSAETSKDSTTESKNGAGTEAAPDQTGSSEDKQSQEADLKGKFKEQQSKIDLLQREIDVLQREQKLRTTTYYSDAGNKLRDPKRFTDEQQKFNDDIDRKKKELDAAKAELEKIKEEARKAGLRIS